MFYVEKDGVQNDPSILSGFEFLALCTSMNAGLEDLISGKFILIDEMADSIDKQRFETDLITIINNLKKYYSTTILISHRDICDEIIDKKFTIISHDSYSTIF